MPSRILQRIQISACDLFSRSGYAGTTTKAIAEAADVTEGSLFRLFGSKAALWKRCLAQVVAEGFSADAFVQSLQGDTFEDRVRHGAVQFWKMARTDHVRFVNFALLETPDVARETYLREVNLANASLAHMIEQERDAGRVRAGVQADIAAEMLLLTLFRVRLLASCHPPRVRPLGSIRTDREAGDEIVELWIRGLLKTGRIKSRKTKANPKSKQSR